MIRELVSVYVNSGLVKVDICGSRTLSAIPLIAEKLIRSGEQLGEEHRIRPEKLVEYYWLERRHGDIRNVPKELYILSRLSMVEALKKDDAKTIREIQHNLRELIQLRLRKILSVVAVNPDIALSREFLDKLTIEEEILVRKIVSLIKDWIIYVLGLA